jgi:hypothetical protein
METIIAEEGKYFFGLSFEPTLQVWMLHNSINVDDKWNKSEYNLVKEKLEFVKQELRSRGITEVYALVDNKKSLKYNKVFGFTPTGSVALDEDGILNIITKLEI